MNIIDGLIIENRTVIMAPQKINWPHPPVFAEATSQTKTKLSASASKAPKTKLSASASKAPKTKLSASASKAPKAKSAARPTVSVSASASKAPKARAHVEATALIAANSVFNAGKCAKRSAKCVHVCDGTAEHDRVHHPGILLLARSDILLSNVPPYLRDAPTVHAFIAQGRVKQLNNIPKNLRTREVVIYMASIGRATLVAVPECLRDDADIMKKIENRVPAIPLYKEERSDADDEFFSIDHVVDRKCVRGRYRYLIRWDGYGADADSWVDEGDVTPDVIAAYDATRPRRR